MLVERWLFFAEATHTVTLYYGREQIPCGQSFIEMIRFAAANQLLVDIDYRDKQGKRSTRSTEAYSLRRSQAG